MKMVIFSVVVVLFAGFGSLVKQAQTLQTIQGELAGGDIFCPQFALQSGEIVSLSGDFPKSENGTAFELKGQWREKSKCMRGREFRVLETTKME